jgi:hypothetical protein
MNCAAAFKKGMSPEEIRQAVVAQNPSLITPVTTSAIFWAVFGALWAFGITAGIAGAILKWLLSPGP